MFNKKVGRYLLYAIGEILLVVIGILLALNINNKNEARKETNEYLRILTSIKYDLIKDTISISQVIPYYEGRTKLASRILNNELSETDYKTCLMCAPMLANEAPVVINHKGSNLLKSFNVSISETDSLAVKIIAFYDDNAINFEPFRKEVRENVMENIQHWRDNYTWFSNVISGKGDPEFIEYISKDPDFKNRVAYFKVVVGDNYLRNLKKYNKRANGLIQAIDRRLLKEKE